MYAIPLGLVDGATVDGRGKQSSVGEVFVGIGIQAKYLTLVSRVEAIAIKRNRPPL